MSEAGRKERKEREVLTPRLRLKPLSERDVAVLSGPSAAGAAPQNLAIALLSSVTGDGETYAVQRRSDRALIGAGGFRLMRGRSAAVEFAVCIAERAWGVGYGTEATQALIDRAFANPGVREVWGSIRVTNDRARHLYEKCGFQPRGTGMARPTAASRAFPVEHVLLSRSAWISLQAWGARDDRDHQQPRRISA